MNTLNTIIAPASEYLFSHCHINPKTGTTGTRAETGYRKESHLPEQVRREP